MKRIILVAAVLIFNFQFSIFNSAHAQHPEDDVARHTVKFNLLSPFARSLDFNYEYRIASRSAVAVDFGGNLLRPMGQTMKPHAIFLQPQYRFYLARQRRNGVMPFLGIGLNYTRAWEHFDCFTGNDGWEIHTQRYTVHDQALRPALAFGLKVNIPFGLTIESTMGVILFNEDNTWRSPLYNTSTANYLTTQFSTRIGWAF